MARVASIKTIQQNISHIRKMLSRVRSTTFSIPPEGASYVVRRRGSQLIIDGKVYKPADLEKIIKSGEKVPWRAEAVDWLEKRLKSEEYRYTARRGKTGHKITALTDLEVKQALEGQERITDPEELEFDNWLNDGSPGWKKNKYYHVYGADSVNKGDIRGFYNFNRVDNLEQLKEVLGE